ncbi:MAG: glycogen debranching N-terminal domain-containing protein, partial [Vicinamibacterales bacterium]
GTVRVYMRDARGAPQFIGESAIPHTPMGSTLALKTGEAFDVKIQPVVEKREKISDRVWRTMMSYKLTNARAQPVTVELAQAGLDWVWDETRIIAESQKSARADADEAVWEVVVPANGSTTLTVTFETRF